jgi:hypothetical protein
MISFFKKCCRLFVVLLVGYVTILFFANGLFSYDLLNFLTFPLSLLRSYFSLSPFAAVVWIVFSILLSIFLHAFIIILVYYAMRYCARFFNRKER